MSQQPVLIAGQWTTSTAQRFFQAVNPQTGQMLPEQFPVSPWEEVERAIHCAADAAREVRGWSGDRFAAFLEIYAEEIEARADDLVRIAHAETALPESPRLKDAELPRTTNQLRQAAEAARAGSWTNPIIDIASNIRSMRGPIGPVVVFGPNNFPFAFNGIAGGDFAAAIAAGNPVIAKGHSSHPSTTRLFAEAAAKAVKQAGLPAGFVQLIYRTSHEDGLQLVSHRKIGAVGFTGSRAAGLQLKAAADQAGKPIYLELSSINPVFILPAAIAKRRAEIAAEFCGSCLMGTGQFCTNPGLIVLKAGSEADSFIGDIVERFEAAVPGTMLSAGVREHFLRGIEALIEAGAKRLTGGNALDEPRIAVGNALLQVDAKTFLQHAAALQTEAFGNGSLVVVAESDEEFVLVAEALEGNLTGCIYSDPAGDDDALYDRVAPALRAQVGRLLNDKMPTGVAVSAAMNHGGPFPATGHPGFTAVGMPTSISRFTMLHCFDNVRPHRLPVELRDQNPTGALWRLIDGVWTTADCNAATKSI